MSIYDPIQTDTAYMSVMLFGKAGIMSDLEEATSAMQALLTKYVPGYYSSPLSKAHVEKYRLSLSSKTAIIKIRPFRHNR